MRSLSRTRSSMRMAISAQLEYSERSKEATQRFDEEKMVAHAKRWPLLFVGRLPRIGKVQLVDEISGRVVLF